MASTGTTIETEMNIPNTVSEGIETVGDERSLDYKYAFLIAFADESGNPLEMIAVDCANDAEEGSMSYLTNSRGFIGLLSMEPRINTYKVTNQGSNNVSGTCSSVTIDLYNKFANGETLTKEELSKFPIYIMRKSKTLAEIVETLQGYKNSIVNLYNKYCTNKTGVLANYEGFSIQYYINKIEEKLKG